MSSKNNGGNTDYYAVPDDAKTLNDLIEHKKMNFAVGNMFKAVYCLTDGRHAGTNNERELNKIIYYAKREKKRLKKEADLSDGLVAYYPLQGKETKVKSYDHVLSKKEIKKIYKKDKRENNLQQK